MVDEGDRAILCDCLERDFDADLVRVAVVLGSGLGSFAESLDGARSVGYHRLKGWPRPGVDGHAGRLVLGNCGDVPLLALNGRGHYYERGDAREMAGPIADLAAMGVRTLILTNAAASVRESVGVGSIVVADDHINWSGKNPLVGEAGDARFVDMSEAYSPRLNQAMLSEAEARGIAAGLGTYMWFSGPSFETPAEIRMARTLGATSVGMSTVPEVILARRHGLEVAAFSVITNMGAGMSTESLSHAHTQAQAVKAAEGAAWLLRAAVAKAAT